MAIHHPTHLQGRWLQWGAIRPARAGPVADAAANGLIDVVLITSPDRLARRYAYQATLIDCFVDQRAVASEPVELRPGAGPTGLASWHLMAELAAGAKPAITRRLARSGTAGPCVGKMLLIANREQAQPRQQDAADPLHLHLPTEARAG